MLHILSCSPWKCDFEEMVRIIKCDDDLLLIQDGVLGAIENSRFIKSLINSPVIVYALKEDIEARGIIDRVSSEIKIINYTYFVSLSIKHVNQMNW